jgi:TctA family transporter
MDGYLEKHSTELMTLLMAALLMGTLLVLVPQLLRSNARTQEMLHQQAMKAVDAGQPLPRFDVRSRAAGRTAALVPMVVICSAAAVTCFLVAYRSEYLFAISVAVWSAAGIVSLAAITGGVALLGRLAQLDSGLADDEDDGD